MSRQPRASGYFRTGYGQDLALVGTRLERTSLGVFAIALIAFPLIASPFQLDLACHAEMSTRHLSFLETGRSAPSRDMVLHLAERLDVPLRVVEVVCGDDAEHRRRVEARYAARDHDGIPDWVRVLERRAEYEPYLGPRLVVDTFLAREPVPPVVSYLR